MIKVINAFLPLVRASAAASGSARVLTLNTGIADVDYDELHVQCPPHTTERKLITKIDWQLVPFLCILYLLAFLDRVNIANAKSFRLVEDLNLKDTEYNTGK